MYRRRCHAAALHLQRLFRGVQGRRRAAYFRLASTAAWKWANLDRKRFLALLPSANYGLERPKIALRPNIDVPHGPVCVAVVWLDFAFGLGITASRSFCKCGGLVLRVVCGT